MDETEGKYIGGQKDLLNKKAGVIKKYRQMFLGDVSFFFLLKYELVTTLFTSTPGALGFVLRKLFFRGLFKKIGQGVVFGRNMTIRHPLKIEIGNNVVFDDNTVSMPKARKTAASASAIMSWSGATAPLAARAGTSISAITPISGRATSSSPRVP